ncbi:hypothetical protein FE697_013380 [Mumia zhuanghuii]|uniref:FtsX extracellular domain-containing protein n=2 Tax=Mumia TaxID=1546255 RepID=A0ABW1QLR7_9ACTN|nr:MULTISPECIES: hypothetical protein [Mumia]KAA1422169.1 hypothetical protein FE697_013380 [Mumia zhuanghuii]
MGSRIRSVVVAAAVVGLLATTTGCFRTADPDAMEQVQGAVRDAPAGLDEIVVDEGTDGLSRYVLLELRTTGDDLTADVLGDTLELVGRTLPEAYDSVQIVARTTGDERLEVSPALTDLGLDTAYLVNPNRASVPAPALRAFASSPRATTG